MFYLKKKQIFSLYNRSEVKVRVNHMTPQGFKVISEQDCKELHYLYAEEKK